MNLDLQLETFVDEMFTRRQMTLNVPYRKISNKAEVAKLKVVIRDVLKEVSPSDQTESVIRDSAVKFECRLLLACIKCLPKEWGYELLEPVHNIIRLENERLDKLKELGLGD